MPDRRTFLLPLLFAILLLPSVPAAATEEEAGSYGHLRRVEGSVDLLHGPSTVAVAATANYPLQVGDRLRLGSGANVEVVLPDRSFIQLDENSEVRFAALIYSLDANDRGNVLELVQGGLHLGLTETPGEEGYRLDTANASVFLLQTGTYSLTTDGRSWTQFEVSSGRARVETATGSTLVDSGVRVSVEGDDLPKLEVESLRSGEDSRLASVPEPTVQPFRRSYVPSHLEYAATPLALHGSWIYVSDWWVWRPRVAAGWRPYHSGWWIYTPSGLTWVSTEPWGWLTYHYGSWDYSPVHGWVWYPGSRYTPGAVEWYWGPRYVGWAPLGPYPHPAYDPGWRWTFCPYDRFGYRDSYRHLRTPGQLAEAGGLESILERGHRITDTRGLTPDLWSRPDRLLEAVATLGREPGPTRSRLSPLGAAALGVSPHSVERPPRSWSPDLRRFDRPLDPRAILPERRDARFSRSRMLPGISTRSQPGTLRGSSARPRFGDPPGRLPMSRPGVQAPRAGGSSRLGSPGRTGSGSGAARGALSGSSRPARPDGGPG